MARYDLTLDANDLYRDGSLANGAYGTYDGTHVNGAPLPIHTKARTGVVVVTYSVDYADKRAVLRTSVVGRPLIECPQCRAMKALINLDDNGVFACRWCAPDVHKPIPVRVEAPAPDDWKAMQEQVLLIRKELQDYVSAPNDIQHPGGRLPQPRYRKLKEDLVELEPRMLAAYKAHMQSVVDEIVRFERPTKSALTGRLKRKAGAGSLSPVSRQRTSGKPRSG